MPLPLLSICLHSCRISMETLDADLKSLKSRVISLEENIQKEAELLQQLDTFLQVVLKHTHTSRAAVGACV